MLAKMGFYGRNSDLYTSPKHIFSSIFIIGVDISKIWVDFDDLLSIVIIQLPKTNFQKTSFKISAPILWNALPNELREIKEYEEFKLKLFIYLKNKNQN